MHAAPLTLPQELNKTEVQTNSCLQICRCMSKNLPFAQGTITLLSTGIENRQNHTVSCSVAELGLVQVC